MVKYSFSFSFSKCLGKVTLGILASWPSLMLLLFPSSHPKNLLTENSTLYYLCSCFMDKRTIVKTSNLNHIHLVTVTSDSLALQLVTSASLFSLSLSSSSSSSSFPPPFLTNKHLTYNCFKEPEAREKEKKRARLKQR